MREYTAKSTINSLDGSYGKQVISNKKNREYSAARDIFQIGQRISGTVIGVGENITVQVGGQQAFAPKELKPDARVNDRMLFEVIRVTDRQVFLGAVDTEQAEESKKTQITLMRPDTKRETFLSRKEKEGQDSDREQEYRENIENIRRIADRMTGEDYLAIEEEGFSAEDYSVSGLEKALNRVRSNKSLEHDSEDSTGKTGGFSAQEIEMRLRMANLPVTDEAVRKIMSALHLYSSIGTVTQVTVDHLMSRMITPTLANIYKAQHSSRGAEQGVKLTEQAWKELEPQVKEIITKAGYEANEESLARARWLLDHDQPLTTENYEYYSRLREFSLPSAEEVLDKILTGMGEGAAPQDVNLMDAGRISPDELVDGIKDLGRAEIQEVLRKEKPVTLRELFASRQAMMAMESTGQRENIRQAAITAEEEAGTNHEISLSENQKLDEIRVLRQLEEIRLRMTLKAAYQLERKGFHLETKPLEEVVDALRQQEEEYYRSILEEADMEGQEEHIRILKTAAEGVKALREVPNYILGSTLGARREITAGSLLEEGSRLGHELERMNQAYETMMSRPLTEYGDSIQKAFRNTDAILQEMGMENTIYNQRAIRILGYNGMELTQENIAEVKAYDIQVESLMKNLHPAVTIRLIKEGINPMEMPIEELNRVIEQLRQEQGITSEEKFSTFLQRLERQEGISPDERQAYIGIYRLLYRIDKTDGAALGAVVKADQEITLGHLLTALRSLRKNIDVSIDDGFGMLEERTQIGRSISEQIEAGFRRLEQEGQGEDSSADTGYRENELEFARAAVKQVVDEITPEDMSRITYTANELRTPSGQMDRVQIWDRWKNLSVEEIADALESEEVNKADAQLYEARLGQLREAYHNSEMPVKFLEEYRMPCTTANIITASQILEQESSLLKRIKNITQEQPSEKLNQCLQKIENLADKFIDSNTVNEGYEQLAGEVRDLVSQECSSGKVNSGRLDILKNIGSQIFLMRDLAKREFYQIPIETQQGFMNMNLTVVRNAKESGRVTVSVQTGQLGRVKADISIKGREVNGYIASDSREGCTRLTEIRDNISSVLAEEDLAVKQFEVCFHPEGREAYRNFNTAQDTREQEDPSAERILYRLARQLVAEISAAEKQV